MTSHTQLNYQLLGRLTDELLMTPRLAKCIFGVAIWHLAPLSMDEDLGTSVLVHGRSDHGRLRLGLRGFHALLGRGILAFEWGGGGVNTLLNPRKCTFNLRAGVGLRRARKLSDTLQSITRRFHDPHAAININNAKHTTDKNLDSLG